MRELNCSTSCGSLETYLYVRSRKASRTRSWTSRCRSRSWSQN